MWSDKKRYSQNGFSDPTIYPKECNHKSRDLYLEDYHKAIDRGHKRDTWLEEHRLEALDSDYLDYIENEKDEL